jgi:hypothetical protein
MIGDIYKNSLSIDLLSMMNMKDTAVRGLIDDKI